MSNYEIQTSILKTTTKGLLSIFNKAKKGKSDVDQGKLAVSAGREIRCAIQTDLKTRLAAPRLSEIEAEG